VLLPGAPSQPKLPLFLAQITWVDLRDEKALDKLEWGITGIKPGRSRIAAESDAGTGSEPRAVSR
jgi:hypothetical protein